MVKPLFEAMVSLPKALAPESPSTEVHAEFEASSKKRKWEEKPFTEEFFKDQTNSERKKPVFDIELHLDTPFTADKWRQFLSIQSGQIHLCNTRTRVNNTTAEDSRRNPEPPPLPPPHHHVSLDLDLNLTCDSLRRKEEHCDLLFNEVPSKLKKDSDDHHQDLIPPPSWLSSEGDHKEMVATVCMQCHMLVMLCKSSPSCPNCKFMHPPDQSPSTFLKRRCSLFC